MIKRIELQREARELQQLNGKTTPVVFPFSTALSSPDVGRGPPAGAGSPSDHCEEDRLSVGLVCVSM